MKWIKTKDEMPNEGQEVIFASNEIRRLDGTLLEPMSSAGWFAKGYFYSWLSGPKEKFYGVTHWMPMPVLTKEDY